MGYAQVTLSTALGLTGKELVSIVGGGGKTSLMKALTSEHPGRVVTTTTTRLAFEELGLFSAVVMYGSEVTESSQPSQFESYVAKSEEELFRAVEEILQGEDSCLVVGALEGDKAAGVPVTLPMQLLKLDGVEYVLVEADGSRRLPCKAPAAHEPVIPAGTTVVVPMAGMDALGKPLKDIAHRPELVSRLTGLDLDQNLSEEALAQLLTDDQGGAKGMPDGARLVPFINKVHSETLQRRAGVAARLMLEQEKVDRVVVGSLQTDKPVRQVHRRITGIVLAAGQSKRMGTLKQLLPWGSSTVLGCTLSNLAASLIYDVLVVTGYQAQEVEREVSRLGVESVRNPEFEGGGMISSVQSALRVLPENREAILVMLADQPMIDTNTIDRLIDAWLEGRGELIAPSFHGKRGNPVIFGKRYFDELLALSPGGAPRRLLHGRENEMTLIEVDSEAILQDLDSMEDYDRLRPKGAIPPG